MKTRRAISIATIIGVDASIVVKDVAAAAGQITGMGRVVR